MDRCDRIRCCDACIRLFLESISARGARLWDRRTEPAPTTVRRPAETSVGGAPSPDLFGGGRSKGQVLTRIPVILHERLGNWARQLRPRLYDLPIRWFETRSTADLDQVLTGMASPVVLIDLGSRPAAGLLGLRAILHRTSDARVLVLDAERHLEAAALARELGATHVISGFVAPPVVASLLGRWVTLAHGGSSTAAGPKP